jgi:type IX secretion system PorP/SprF family membrane protein
MSDIILLSIPLVILCQSVSSQQLPLFSQYTFDAFLLNPAAAGSEGYTVVNLTTRAQWVGVDGAPETGNFTYQTRIMKRDYIISNAPVKKRYEYPQNSGRVGLGFGIYYDRAGLIDQTCAFFTYAYHIARSSDQFSLGVTFSLLQYKIDASQIPPSELQSNTFSNGKFVIYNPDASVGAYYTNQNLFCGLSVLQLSQGVVHFQNYDNQSFILYRTSYFTGGYKFELDNVTVLEPSVFLKATELWAFQLDATLKLIYDNRFWIGLAYRTSSTFIASFGVKVDKLYIGYAFDYSLTGLLYDSYGSHELMVAMKFGDNTRRYRWMERY